MTHFSVQLRPAGCSGRARAICAVSASSGGATAVAVYMLTRRRGHHTRAQQSLRYLRLLFLHGLRLPLGLRHRGCPAAALQKVDLQTHQLPPPTYARTPIGGGTAAATTAATGTACFFKSGSACHLLHPPFLACVVSHESPFHRSVQEQPVQQQRTLERLPGRYFLEKIIFVCVISDKCIFLKMVCAKIYNPSIIQT